MSRGRKGAGVQRSRGAEEQGCRGEKDIGAQNRKPIQSHNELEVYQLAFDAAMRIFELTKGFPKEERYSLVDQIRRSSRSVCANIAEAWSPTRLPARRLQPGGRV